MPESTFLFDIIKLWQGMWKWKKKKAEAGSWSTAEFVDWCSEGNLANSQQHKWNSRTLFLPPPRTGRVLAQSLAVCGSQAELEKQTHTRTHTVEGAEFCLLNRGGCMHGWMGDRRNEWGAKSSTLTGLFILHAYTPIRDICDANSAQESKLCLLGSSLYVCGCKWVRRYLCAIYLIYLSLFRLLSLSLLSFKKNSYPTP